MFIAFAGVIEHGYSGSGSAGLVAKAVFEEYFGLTKPKPQPQQQQVTSPPTVPQTPVVEENEPEGEAREQSEETEETPQPEPPEIVIPEQAPKETVEQRESNHQAVF